MAKTAAPRKRAVSGAVSLKVTLLDTEPLIWRRLLVPDSMTLADLHMALQVTMGWQDEHLHVFKIGEARYGQPGIVDDVIDEQRQTLRAVQQAGVDRFTYTYDFGDDWEHEILIEKTAQPEAVKMLPACIAGERACPPEDCGGPWEYADLIAVLADPADPQYQDQREWVGEDFDPAGFSVADANKALARVFRRKRSA